MLLIDRAWKANVNVWKRHLTLQLVFNHGESMVHVDKNVDGHVLDQNVDRILRKIAYVPLSGRIRSKRSSYSPFFFLFWKKKWVQDMLTIGLVDLKFWTCFPEVRWIGILDVLSRGPKIEFWMCFPEVHGFEFGHAFQRSDGLKFGRASQWSDGLESWTCFLEV